MRPDVATRNVVRSYGNSPHFSRYEKLFEFYFVFICVFRAVTCLGRRYEKTVGRGWNSFSEKAVGSASSLHPACKDADGNPVQYTAHEARGLNLMGLDCWCRISRATWRHLSLENLLEVIPRRQVQWLKSTAVVVVVVAACDCVYVFVVDFPWFRNVSTTIYINRVCYSWRFVAWWGSPVCWQLAHHGRSKSSGALDVPTEPSQGGRVESGDGWRWMEIVEMVVFFQLEQLQPWTLAFELRSWQIRKTCKSWFTFSTNARQNSWSFTSRRVITTCSKLAWFLSQFLIQGLQQVIDTLVKSKILKYASHTNSHHIISSFHTISYHLMCFISFRIVPHIPASPQIDFHLNMHRDVNWRMSRPYHPTVCPRTCMPKSTGVVEMSNLGVILNSIVWTC